MRELFLQHKAAELDREMGVIRRQEEMGRCVRMLTHEIRSSIDRHTILETTLVELANTLNLENCTVWMPNASGTHLDLAHEQERRMVQVPLSVPASDPTVQAVLATSRATRIPHYSPLGEASALRSREECSMAAVRLPLLHVYESEGPGVEQAYAVMVLVLPGDAKRAWKPQQVEMVEVVADQVAVALSHAAVVEESHRTRDQLVEQHRRLQVARIKAETAVRARNDFLAVMNHELRTPLQAVIGLASILREQGLGTEQTPMVETILNTSSLLSTLISDVLRFSRLEGGEVKLDHAPFNLPALFQDAGKLAWPMARGKGLEFALQMEEVPLRVVGDEKRLLQTLLNVVGNAVKNTPKGSVTIKVGLDSPASARDPGRPSWEVEASERHCVLRVEVRDTGKGLAEAEVASQFRHFGIGRMAAEPAEEGMGLGLAICQRFVEVRGPAACAHMLICSYAHGCCQGRVAGVVDGRPYLDHERRCGAGVGGDVCGEAAAGYRGEEEGGGEVGGGAVRARPGGAEGDGGGRPPSEPGGGEGGAGGAGVHGYGGGQRSGVPGGNAGASGAAV